MRLPPFDYYAPQTLDQALNMKRDTGNSGAIPAGGTDLVVNLKNRLLPRRRAGEPTACQGITGHRREAELGHRLGFITDDLAL